MQIEKLIKAMFWKLFSLINFLISRKSTKFGRIKYAKQIKNMAVKCLYFLIRNNEEKNKKYIGTSTDTDHTGVLKLHPVSNPQFDAKKIFKIKWYKSYITDEFACCCVCSNIIMLINCNTETIINVKKCNG